MAPEIRVFLADDHAGFRDEVRRLLAHSSDIRIVGEADNGEDALTALCGCDADVAVLDLDMPKKDGIEVADAIRGRGLGVRPVLLTAHKSQALVRRALGAGVTGYVLKDDAVAELVECVRAVHAGRRHFSPQLGSCLPQNQ